jgi:glutamate dehydrogenase
LVPVAIENQIVAGNVEKINSRVKIIAEGANGATNPDADALLAATGVVVIPDLLANAASVISGYFEQVQSNMNYYWNREEVLGKLDVQITSAYLEVGDFARKNKIPMREAAYLMSVERVAQACHERGWV